MRIAPGQNTKPKPMYIITNKNELFEHYYDPAYNFYLLLYHSDEVSIKVHAYSDEVSIKVHTYGGVPHAWASLRGQIDGIYLVHVRRGSYPVGTRRRENWGPYVDARLDPVKYEHPTLGEIPPEHRETLKEAIKKLTSRSVKGHELLQSKLEEVRQSL